MDRKGFSPIIIVAIIAVVLITGGIWYYFSVRNSGSLISDIRQQCYEKAANLDSPIRASYSSKVDLATIQNVASDLRGLSGIDSVEVTSASEALQSFKQQQAVRGNQDVLNALSELGGNPLGATLEVDVKSDVVSSTLTAIDAEDAKYSITADSVTSMESLKQSTLQGISSAPNNPSSTQLFEQCVHSTSSVFSPTTFYLGG
jgi:cell division protein FtsX